MTTQTDTARELGYGDDVVRRLLLHSVVDHATGCWLWTGCKSKAGYGRINVRGANRLAHRISYTALREDPGSLLVCHRCDTPACINPNHLFLGTDADNNRDKIDKGRGRVPLGEHVNTARLNAAKVRLIRASPLSDGVLAELHGVTRSTINKIRTGKTWKSVR